MAKDYYLILGIASDATPDEIRTAYRNRAKELHPDRSGETSGPFQDVQEAYSILSDPKTRQNYDVHKMRARSTERPSAEPIEHPGDFQWTPVDLGERSISRSFHAIRPSFDALFDRLRRNFGPSIPPKSERVEPLHVEIIITPAEARHGGQIRLGVPVQMVCPTCRGQGQVGLWWCMHCEGAGHLMREHPVAVSFPPGIRGDHTASVSLANLGVHNLYLTVHFRVL